MPFNFSTLQDSPTISNHRISPLSSANTSPEMRLWDQVRTFFDSTQESDALACVRNIYHPPASTTREALVNRFEQLRAFTYPGYKENIQSARHGENHFCILGENGQEILSVTLGDTGTTYEVEYEGRRIRYPLIQSQQEHEAEIEIENTAEAPIIKTPLTAEECEAIWAEWEVLDQEVEEEDSDCSVSEASSYTKELRDRAEVVRILRKCLKNNHPKLLLRDLCSLYDLPQALPPHITELTIEHISSPYLHLPPLPPGLQMLNLSRISLADKPLVLPQGLRTLMLDELNITELPELPHGLNSLFIKELPLTRLPELPPGLQALEIENMPPDFVHRNDKTELITDKLEITSLPYGLQMLYIYDTQLTRLPTLPNGLKTLYVHDTLLTRLPALPNELQTLYVRKMELTELPTLPSKLTELVTNDIAIVSLPELPPTLQTLDLYDTPLTRLPTLPDELQTLKLRCIPLVELPALPSRLTELIAEKLDIDHLPELPLALQDLEINSMSLAHLPSLPPTLQRLNLNDMSLSHLPPLPPTLQNLYIQDLPLTHLPPLPPTVQFLYINNIPLISGLEDVVNLSPTANIRLTCATMSERMIQTMRQFTSEPGYSGPSIYFDMAGSSLPREARMLHQAVTAWLQLPEEKIVTAADKWKAFEQENHASSFSLFLDQLSDTKNFRQHSEFKIQVSSWLTLLVEDNELRAKTFTMATESTSSCEDRVTLAMNQMKRVQLLHQAEKGLFDERIPELVAAGREMFRLEQLEQIAREKTKTLKLVDEIEVWLGYQNQLKQSLELTSVTAEMNYFDLSGITRSDLQTAEARVKAAENSQFTTWILQWTPLHSLLQRTAPERWEALIEKKSMDYEEQYQTLSDTELKPAGLVGDSEAERTIGTRAMASAEDAFLQGLRLLTDQKLGRHLQQTWL